MASVLQFLNNLELLPQTLPETDRIFLDDNERPVSAFDGSAFAVKLTSRKPVPFKLSFPDQVPDATRPHYKAHAFALKRFLGRTSAGSIVPANEVKKIIGAFPEVGVKRFTGGYLPQLVRESLPLYNPLTWVVAPLCQDLGDIDEEKPPRDDGTLWCPEVEWTDTRFGPVEELLHAAAQLRLKQAGIKFISSEQQEDWYKDEVSSILPISDSSMIYERMGGMFEELPMPASEVQDSMELRPDQSYLRRPPRRRPARLYKISISNNAMHELTAREYDEGVAGMNVLRRHVSGRYVVDFLPFESDGNPGKQPDAVETTEVGMQTSEPPRPKSAARPKKKVWAQFKHANTITVVELKNKKGESALSEKQWENKYKEWATLATCPPVSLPRPSWTEELERRLFVEDRETPIKLDEKREREFLHKQQLWKQAKEKVRERIEEWDADMNARLIQPLKVVDAEERQKWAGDYDADDLHHTLRATAFRRCRGGRRFLHRFERDTTWPPIETRVPPPDPRPDIDPARLRNPSQGVFVPNKAHSLRHPGAVMRGRPRPKER